MTVTVPAKVLPPNYGWSGDGKSAAEIASDVRQTRYRLEADVRALRRKLAPKRLAPVVAGLAAVALLVGLLRRRRRRR
jgi:hypothetical protein